MTEDDRGEPTGLEACCLEEARRSIHRGREVAVCDGCGSLVLGYDDRSDYDSTLEELKRTGTPHRHAKEGELYLVSKARRGR